MLALRAVGSINLDVWYFRNRTLRYRTAGCSVTASRAWKNTPKNFEPLGTQTETASKVHKFAIEPDHERKLTVAQLHCTLCDRIKYGLNVRRGAGNDAQHLRGRRLLLERFA